MEPIESGFETDIVFRLDRDMETYSWTLREERLEVTYRKRYDDGDPAEWLPSYEEVVPRQDFHFLGAHIDGRVEGLLTWRELRWNQTLWLIDIRVRRELRGSGIGSALMEDLKATARQRGVRGISVETQINNYPAIRFYRAHRFDVAGFNDHLYANDDLERQDVALSLFWETGPH